MPLVILWQTRPLHQDEVFLLIRRHANDIIHTAVYGKLSFSELNLNVASRDSSNFSPGNWAWRHLSPSCCPGTQQFQLDFLEDLLYFNSRVMSLSWGRSHGNLTTTICACCKWTTLLQYTCIRHLKHVDEQQMYRARNKLAIITCTHICNTDSQS